MKRKLIIGVTLAILLICYGYRVYKVNTSDIVEYAKPITLKYQVNEAVELMEKAPLQNAKMAVIWDAILWIANEEQSTATLSRR